MRDSSAYSAPSRSLIPPKPITDSTPSRSPIPLEADQQFRRQADHFRSRQRNRREAAQRPWQRSVTLDSFTNAREAGVAYGRLSMRKTKEVLRLKFDAACPTARCPGDRISCSTVAETVGASSAGLSWPLPEGSAKPPAAAPLSRQGRGRR